MPRKKAPLGLPPALTLTPTPTPGEIFSLKITLVSSQPPIWRQIETPDCTLLDLHDIIQRCFAWDESHLWEFTVGRSERYDCDDDVGLGTSTGHPDDVRLSQFVARKVKKIYYMYDYGDSWKHEIVFHKPRLRETGVTYPRCIAGERAGPPEDSGGVGGYAYKLQVLKDRNHQSYKRICQWMGKRFDPEAFDLAAINAKLAKLNLDNQRS